MDSFGSSPSVFSAAPHMSKGFGPEEWSAENGTKDNPVSSGLSLRRVFFLLTAKYLLNRCEATVCCWECAWLFIPWKMPWWRPVWWAAELHHNWSLTLLRGTGGESTMKGARVEVRTMFSIASSALVGGNGDPLDHKIYKLLTLMVVFQLSSSKVITIEAVSQSLLCCSY